MFDHGSELGQTTNICHADGGAAIIKASTAGERDIGAFRR